MGFARPSGCGVGKSEVEAQSSSSIGANRCRAASEANVETLGGCSGRRRVGGGCLAVQPSDQITPCSGPEVIVWISVELKIGEQAC